MRFIPPGPGFAPPPGGGTIQQNGRTGPIVRQRTIQHQHGSSNPYLGSIPRTNRATPPSYFDRTKLRIHAEYWAEFLLPSERTLWDNWATTHGAPWSAKDPGTINGFSAFMSFNHCASASDGIHGSIQGGCYGDWPSPASWDFTPIRPTPPLSYAASGARIAGFTLTPHDQYTWDVCVATFVNTGTAQNCQLQITRPFRNQWNPRRNPLVRIAGFTVNALGSIINVAPYFERLIGGARSGDWIVAASRSYNPRNAAGGPTAAFQIAVQVP